MDWSFWWIGLSDTGCQKLQFVRISNPDIKNSNFVPQSNHPLRYAIGLEFLMDWTFWYRVSETPICQNLKFWCQNFKFVPQSIIWLNVRIGSSDDRTSNWKFWWQNFKFWWIGVSDTTYILPGLGSITFKCNALHYHYFEFSCITLHYHYFVFRKVMHYITLLFKSNALHYTLLFR